MMEVLFFDGGVGGVASLACGQCVKPPPHMKLSGGKGTDGTVDVAKEIARSAGGQ